jgi:uncharacterized membrane protein
LHSWPLSRRDSNTAQRERQLRMELTRQITDSSSFSQHLAARQRATSALPRVQARASAPEQRALGLGWFSVGLGLAQLVAPRQVAQLIGVDDDEQTCLAMRALGVRELTCGIGLLSETRPAAWAWARVAGDVMDLMLLGYAYRDDRPSADRALSTAGSLLGVTWLDAQTALQLGREQRRTLADGVGVRQAVTIERTPDDVYAFFRKLEGLPTFMYHLQSVTESNGRSHWQANGPLGKRVEWDAEIIEDRPGQRIVWRSLPGADVPNRGCVEFRPGPNGRGTELVVELRYEPPAGAIGSTLAKLFGREPAQEISADLRRLKQVLETGEVTQSDASIHPAMHPARPSALSNEVSERKALR